MENTQNSYLVTERPLRLIRKFSLPCVISLVTAALYNIADQIFIANTPSLGSNGNAANTVVFPLTVIALAIAVMIGDGCCSFMSISLGKGNQTEASNGVGSSILVAIPASIVLMLVYLICAEPILSAFGGHVNETTYLFSSQYLFWISLGIPFYMFGQMINPIIRGDGSPKFAMIATLSGAILNIILDPLFLFGFGWGMMGAALATISGQIVTAILSVWYLFHLHTICLEKESFRFYPHLMKEYLPLGFTSFLSQISLVMAMAAIQNMTLKYSALDPVFSKPEFAQIPMAVLGIVMKFFQIVISIAVGLAAGSIPVVGFNLGAKKNNRVKNLFSCLLALEAITGAIALVIVEFFPQYLIGIFGAANESAIYTEYGMRCFRIYLCMLIFATMNKGTFIFLQAIGKAVESSALSFIREVVFGVGFALVLPRFFGLNGILYSMPVSDLLTMIISLIVIIQTYHSLSHPKQFEKDDVLFDKIMNQKEVEMK